MTDRHSLAQAFLATHGWRDAEISILAGDASNRKYFRVRNARGKPDAVLMDAPRDRGEDVRPFIKVARHLTEIGLSAPQIFAEDIGRGFLLLEDLGDGLFSTLCDESPELELTLYRAATDALITLQQASPPMLETYSAVLMADLAAEAVDWYALGRDGQGNADAKEHLRIAMRNALMPFEADFQVPILRDFHAQNLLWLPDRTGPTRVGLLDFQDAMIGHPTYDLVSLLEDARRDVTPQTQQSILEYFIAQTGTDPSVTRAAYRTMGAQRNLRILMVFARLSLHFGKKDYVDLIPRTWAHLLGNLSHPDMADLRRAVMAALPAPTDDHLTELKDKCGTHPTR